MRSWMIAFGVSVLLSASAGAETWICKQPDGSEVFSDSGSGPHCTRYVPKSELGKSAGGAMGEPDREGYSQPSTAPEGRSLTEAGARQPGEITFEQFRMLSTGMTEGQVLAKIGAPLFRSTINCTTTRQELTQREYGEREYGERKYGERKYGERKYGMSYQDESTTVTCPTVSTYSLEDGWTADLTFSDGRLVDIQNTKTP